MQNHHEPAKQLDNPSLSLSRFEKGAVMQSTLSDHTQVYEKPPKLIVKNLVKSKSTAHAKINRLNAEKDKFNGSEQAKTSSESSKDSMVFNSEQVRDTVSISHEQEDVAKTNSVNYCDAQMCTDKMKTVSPTSVFDQGA